MISYNAYGTNGANAPKIPTTKISESTKTISCIIWSAACVLIGLFALLILNYALPVADIIMGSINNNVTACDTSLPSVHTWLIVKGAVGLFISTYTSMSFVAKRTETNFFVMATSVFRTPFNLSLLFMWAWLIVGSVMFWRDCRHLGPDSLNTMMWCSIIIGYFYVLLSSCSLTKS